MNSVDVKLQIIIDWIRQTTDVAGGRGALVPISGGSDSALCFWLCSKALPSGRAIGAFIGSKLRCKSWFESLGPVQYLTSSVEAAHPEATRWASLLTLSLSVRGWLVGTRNRTEDVLGTYSLASRVATYLPLAGLWKSEVMQTSTSVGIPYEILASSRRADPSCGRPQQMADIPFEIVDQFLREKVGENDPSHQASIPTAIRDYLESIYCRNQFKKVLPLTGPSFPTTAPPLPTPPHPDAIQPKWSA